MPNKKLHHPPGTRILLHIKLPKHSEEETVQVPLNHHKSHRNCLELNLDLHGDRTVANRLAQGTNIVRMEQFGALWTKFREIYIAKCTKII